MVPSAGAAFSACAAIWPPAPGLFSTITGTPISSLSRSARMRAMASVPPPGGKPTISLMVFGVWALATPSAPTAARAKTVRVRRDNRPLRENVMSNSGDG